MYDPGLIGKKVKFIITSEEYEEYGDKEYFGIIVKKGCKNYIELVLLIFLSLIPPMLISLIIIMYSFVEFRFPNKYNLEDLECDSIWYTFISLIN